MITIIYIKTGYTFQLSAHYADLLLDAYPRHFITTKTTQK